MSKQSHDPGVRKRRIAKARRFQQLREDTPEAHAIRLVEQGICSPRILTRPTIKENRK